MKNVLLFCLCLSFTLLHAQAPKRWTTADIEAGLHRLNTLGSVLYIAAHPDDENTNLIAYLSNARHLDTRYISLTRGDGGQNLIGNEIREQLGVLRTQELMAARRIDGGLQQFSRANDFGYSKNPEETLRIWNKDEVLADLVWAIRLHRPDVLVNRFWHTTERPNHGHHTASAQLGLLAFDLANDPKAFPEQLKYVQIWQPKRIVCNLSWWFYGGPEAFEKIDKSRWYKMDINQYYFDKGLSNRELSAISRSQHQCQAMGTMTERTASPEYFELLKGDSVTNNDPFSDIPTSWNRIAGGQLAANLAEMCLRTFNSHAPEASVPALVQLRRAIEKLPESQARNSKLAACNDLIAACLGLYFEAVATDFTAVAGALQPLSLEVTLRSKSEVKLVSFSAQPMAKDSTLNLTLLPNQSVKWKTMVQIPTDAPITTAYWLQNSWSNGMYQVEDQNLVGLPETPRYLKVLFKIVVAGETLVLPFDVAYKWEAPNKGELWRPFDIVPAATLRFLQTSYVFDSGEARKVQVEVRAGSDNVEGQLALQLPDGWKSKTDKQAFKMALKGETQIFEFEVMPSKSLGKATLAAELSIKNERYNQMLTTIQYDHIPAQLVLQPAVTQLARMDLKRKGQNIGYVMGAGDEIPTALRDAGYAVTILGKNDCRPENLAQFDAVLLGIRAYNTQEWLKFAQPALFDYAKNGGALIVQYNTNFDLFVDSLLPVSFKLSRERVTDENAIVDFVLPKHAVLNTPNVLQATDFDTWTQERGIYYASEWDTTFEAPLSMADPGETAKQGALIVAPYGKGFVAYTGLAFFRQLPAGVPGAYKLMANLIGLGQGGEVVKTKKKGKV